MSPKPKKPTLPPRLQKKSKQGIQKLNKTLKRVPLQEALKPEGMLSALEDKARECVKPQKLAAGGVAKIRLGQSTQSGQQQKGPSQ